MISIDIYFFHITIMYPPHSETPMYRDHYVALDPQSYPYVIGSRATNHSMFTDAASWAIVLAVFTHLRKQDQ